MEEDSKLVLHINHNNIFSDKKNSSNEGQLVNGHVVWLDLAERRMAIYRPKLPLQHSCIRHERRTRWMGESLFIFQWICWTFNWMSLTWVDLFDMMQNFHVRSEKTFYLISLIGVPVEVSLRNL